MIRVRPLVTRIRRSGFTLMEVVLASAVLVMLMAAMGTAIRVSSRAMPDETSGVSLTLSNGRALDRFSADLAVAKSILASSATSIQFTVADQGGTVGDETITYSWAGTGSPLNRQINSGTASSVLANVQSFSLTYFTKTVVLPPSVYLKSVAISLKSGTGSGGRLDTTVSTANLPVMIGL
jgi:prepilin-type N-terminal cleavage/methylation domain-containing protein